MPEIIHKMPPSVVPDHNPLKHAFAFDYSNNKKSQNSQQTNKCKNIVRSPKTFFLRFLHSKILLKATHVLTNFRILSVLSLNIFSNY